uniref:Uncharacterized protein n=1 Tax=viral metagenome TaxID=1070528 RepID=A0A6M3K2W4_9ZZZZ
MKVNEEVNEKVEKSGSVEENAVYIDFDKLTPMEKMQVAIFTNTNEVNQALRTIMKLQLGIFLIMSLYGIANILEAIGVWLK